MTNGAPLGIGDRVDPPTFHPDSALADSLLTEQYLPAPDSHPGIYPFPSEDAYYGRDYDGRYGQTAADGGWGASSGSQYGSPGRNEAQLPISGVERRITALDAPLPASFDSNGISHIARYGRLAASVPSKFGMDSPPPAASSPLRSSDQPIDPVKTMHTSLAPSNLRNSSQLASSPSVIHTKGVSSVDHKAHLLSGAQRWQALSSSVPRPTTTTTNNNNDDWDDSFPLEEDFLPPNLHDDVLTPQERIRRSSRPEQDFHSARTGGLGSGGSSGGLGIGSGSPSKVVSPLGSSPSRFSALFAKQRQESNGASSAAVATSGVGAGGGLTHVGSPLRESHIQQMDDVSPFGDGIAARPSSGSRVRTSQTGAAGEQARAAAAAAAPPLTPSLEPRDAQQRLGQSLIASQLQRPHLKTPSRSSESYDAHHTASRLLSPGLPSLQRHHPPPPPSPNTTGDRGGGGAAAAAAAANASHNNSDSAGSPRVNATILNSSKLPRTASSPGVSSTSPSTGAIDDKEREGEGDLVFSMDGVSDPSFVSSSSRSPVIPALLKDPSVAGSGSDSRGGGRNGSSGIAATASTTST